MVKKEMTKYFDKLKNKFTIQKFSEEQPIRVWLFVLILNIVGFAGYFYLKLHDIKIPH